jgi:putative flippase GtrA
LAGQVVRFGIVGALNTLVDFGLFNVLFHFVGLPLLVANSLSVAAGIANSFIWNKHWTFSAGGRAGWKREVVIFVLVSVIGLLLNNAGIYVLTRLSGNMGVLALNLQKLAASAVSMTWNFLGYRLIAFRHHGSAVSE